ATTQTLPKWATLDRRDVLASILTDYLAIKGWQLDLMTGELYNLDYEARIKPIIADWKHLDKEQSQADWEAERKALHSLGDRSYPIRGQFSAISRDIYAESQPLYYLEGQAVSGLTLKPFVRVRIASSYIRLYVDLGKDWRQVSKNKRRQAIRYGKPLPQSITEAIRRKVLEAVKDYYSH
ncbi:unnamed protein product, partial [marine sediment metagenome]